MYGLPFAAIAVMALRRQWHLPNAARIEQTQQALATMAWPAFADLLEQAVPTRWLHGTAQQDADRGL